MKILLIINIISLVIALVAITISFTQLIKAEHKLAEFNKSSIFTKKDDTSEV